jgi:hypothetical protein
MSGTSRIWSSWNCRPELPQQRVLMVTGSKPAPAGKREVDDGYKDALGESSAGDWLQY